MNFPVMLLLASQPGGAVLPQPARATPVVAESARDIRGRVTDAAGKPLRDAVVVLLPDSLRARSDGAGVFVFPHAPAGKHSVWVLREDYRPVWRSLEGQAPGDSLRIALQPVMEPAAPRAPGPAPDAALAAEVATHLGSAEEVRGYRLVARFMDQLPAGRDIPGVGFVTEELGPLDAGRRALLGRLLRRAGAADCAAAPEFREAATWNTRAVMAHAVRRTTFAVAVMDGPAPLVLEMSDDGRVCVLRRDGRDLPGGTYHTECVADSLRILIDALSPAGGKSR